MCIRDSDNPQHLIEQGRRCDTVLICCHQDQALSLIHISGQFIIFRVDEFSERVPLTIADYDREKGTVTIIFQKVGLSTKLLAAKEVGDSIRDFVGPLGVATEYDGFKKVAVVGGGVGCAIAYPQAKALHELGVEVDVIAGFRKMCIRDSGKSIHG